MDQIGHSDAVEPLVYVFGELFPQRGRDLTRGDWRASDDGFVLQHEQFFDGPEVGGFTIQTDGSLLLFMEKGAIARWNNGTLDYILKEIPEERETRFNDVAADPAGRVFCGTMPSSDHPGSLYRLDTDGSITHVLGDIGISNGIGFTPDQKQMYYTDSASHNIYIFDYNID